MGTFTTLYTRIFSSFVVTLFLSSELFCQQGNSLTASADATYSESKRLTTEAENFAAQAVSIRENAKLVRGDGQKMMLEEAESFEKLSLKKMAESLDLTYLGHRKSYESNNEKVKELTKKKTAVKHAMQLKYLSEQNVKNYKSAEVLYNEGKTSNSLALQVGEIENAIEKLVLAIKQQNEMITLYKEEAIAKR